MDVKKMWISSTPSSTRTLCLYIWVVRGVSAAELDVIRTGNIHYKHAEIHDVDVKFAGCAGIVYSRIHLNSVVGGREVRFPFIVTETYVKEDGQWKLATLAFTRTVKENNDKYI